MYIVVHHKACIAYKAERKSIQCAKTSKMLLEILQSFLVDGARFIRQEECPIITKAVVSEFPPKKVMPFCKAITF